MSTADLLNEVQVALGSAVTLGYPADVEAHDVYEAYVLSLFLQAAKNEQWIWALNDKTGAATTHAIFRRGPGRLPSGDYTHLHLSKPGRESLEVHTGIKVAGTAPRGVSRRTKSGLLLHEFDLLVLPSSVADACRATNDDPSHTAVVAHAEAKFYGGDLSLPIGRAAVGLAVECSLSGRSTLVTNQNGLTVQDLVEHYGVAFRFLIKPSNPTGVYHLVQRFQHILQAAP